MRKVIFTLCLLFLCQSIALAQSSSEREDSVKVMSLLDKAPVLSTTTEYMNYFGRQLVGTPYVAKTLDKDREEHLVVNLRQLDCTTFVETVLALSLCMRHNTPTFDAYKDYLRRIRYHQGDISYPSRLHYFSSWIENNIAQGFVYEAPQDSLPSVYDETQTLNTTYMTTHPEEYPQLKNDSAMVSKIRLTEQQLTGRQYKYIPKRLLQRNIKALKKYVQNGDIIAIVTNKSGLDIAHVGLAAWHSDGTLHLLNASQVHKKVIDEPMTLYNYMMKHPSQIGIRVIHPL